MIAYPLNNTKYFAEAAQLFHATRTSGVAHEGFDASVSGTTLSLSPGMGWIRYAPMRGIAVGEAGRTKIDLGQPDPNLRRIDAVVIRFSTVDNAAKIMLKKGKPGYAYVPPDVERTGEVYELHLYQIRRGPGKAAVDLTDLIDLRPNPEYCGYMMDDMTGVDPTLTKAGYVADAAAVGARLENVQEKGDYATRTELFTGLRGKQDKLDDYIVDSGVTGNWSWRKWKSGTVECWGSFSSAITFQAWQNCAMATMEVPNYPVNFAGTPEVSVAPASDTPLALMCASSNGSGSRVNIGTIQCIRPGSDVIGVSYTAKVCVHAFGRWE